MKQSVLNIKNVVCIFSLLIRHAKLIISAPLLLLSVAWRVLQYFPSLSHKGHGFRKKFRTYTACFGFLYNYCLKPSHSKTNSTMCDRTCT
jgi:hypothetical protein